MNGENSAAAWSGRIPIPVSVTVKRTVAVPSPWLSSAASSVTSPRSVNLMALAQRLVNTWRRRWASPRRSGGISGDTREWKSQSLRVRLDAQKLDDVLDRVAQVEAQILQGDLPRLDLGKVQDVVDEGQQSPPAGLSHVGVIAVAPE